MLIYVKKLKYIFIPENHHFFFKMKKKTPKKEDFCQKICICQKFLVTLQCQMKKELYLTFYKLYIKITFKNLQL